MRILHIAQAISGGIASYFEEIAGFQTRLFGMGDVRFLIPAGSRHHVPSIKENQVAEFAPGSRSMRGLFALAKAAYRETESFSPTIVHLHSTFAGAIIRPILLLSKRKPSVVYCAHGWAFAMEASAWEQKLFSLFERSLVPLTDAIVNISHSDAQLAHSYGISLAKMVTIYNGIATVPPVSSKARTRFEPGKLHLIFVGRHDRQKGLDYLLDVFCGADLPGIHLHIVGAPVLGRSGGIRQTKYPSNITFYGWKSRNAVSSMIAAADALIMPSRWEGFGLVALEAMRVGKPVLASRRGALAEIVEHGRTGMHFDLDHPSELRDILFGLRKKNLAEMGKAARSKFLHSFTSDRLNGELIALYRNLLERKAGEQAFPWAVRRNRLQWVWPNK